MTPTDDWLGWMDHPPFRRRRPLSRDIFFWVGLGGLLLVLSSCDPVLAAPPVGADPNSAMSRWIQSLRDPDGVSCCSEADCRQTMIGLDPDGVRWAWIGKDEFGSAAPDEWRRISERVWQGTTAEGPSPNGRAYVCFHTNRVVCAISGGGI